MKKGVVAGLTAFGVAVVAGVAYAVISGSVATSSLETGSAVSSGTSSCQNGTQLNFTWPDPTWSDSAQEYQVSTLDYSNIAAGCVSLGTADLNVNISVGGSTVADGDSTNMSATSGTITLSQALAYTDATSSTINFYVKNS